MRRFFTDQPLTENTEITLCDQSYHHWVRVLRAKVGDTAVLFHGKGGEYEAELTGITKKSATVNVGSFNPINRDNPYHATVAIVMSKGDRIDYALQKSTELGVHDIQLLTSEHCDVKLAGERLEKKLKNWRGVITSACEQCGLNIVPVLHAPMPISDFVAQANHDLKLVLAPTENGQANMPLAASATSIQAKPPQRICLLIGAEGGLTATEIEHATAKGFMPWCLGERILRTETAPVVALSYVFMCYQNTHSLCV